MLRVSDLTNLNDRSVCSRHFLYPLSTFSRIRRQSSTGKTLERDRSHQKIKQKYYDDKVLIFKIYDMKVSGSQAKKSI